MPRAHFYIEGDVQGVGFRAFVEREARKLSLTGWVQNTEDDGLEALAEGPKDKLEQLHKLLLKRPSSAEIESVQTIWEQETGKFRNFEVIS